MLRRRAPNQRRWVSPQRRRSTRREIHYRDAEGSWIFDVKDTKGDSRTMHSHRYGPALAKTGLERGTQAGWGTLVGDFC